MYRIMLMIAVEGTVKPQVKISRAMIVLLMALRFLAKPTPIMAPTLAIEVEMGRPKPR